MASRGGSGNLLKSTSINGVKMYSIFSQQRSVAAWIPPKKQRALRKDAGTFMFYIFEMESCTVPTKLFKIFVECVYFHVCSNARLSTKGGVNSGLVV